jgi:ribosome-binding protein aMBF1 (putative translation factor)
MGTRQVGAKQTGTRRHQRHYTDQQVLCHIREEIRQSGASQKEYAARIGFSETHLSDILHGRRPMVESLARAVGFLPCERKWTKV